MATGLRAKKEEQEVEGMVVAMEVVTGEETEVEDKVGGEKAEEEVLAMG